MSKCRNFNLIVREQDASYGTVGMSPGYGAIGASI